MSLTIQYVSDVHLEHCVHNFSSIIDLAQPADVLVLAGDIGCPKDSNFKEFLIECKSHFATVLFVPGNHEYLSCYPDSLETTDSLMAKICQECNIVLLNGMCHQIRNVNFIGSTLWSNINNPLSKDIEILNKRHFRGMNININTKFTVESNNAMFQQNMIKIKSCIENNLVNVVITHHAPFMKSPKNYLDATDLTEYMSNIHTWIYGHTHRNLNACFNGTMVVCNQFACKKGWLPLAQLQILDQVSFDLGF